MGEGMKCGGCGQMMMRENEGFVCPDCETFVSNSNLEKVRLAEHPAYTNLKPPPFLKEGRHFPDQ